MRLTYDRDFEFEATPGFMRALEELAREHLKMMRAADSANAESWAYCDVVIGDMADAAFVEFFCGAAADKPEGMGGEVRVRRVI